VCTRQWPQLAASYACAHASAASKSASSFAADPCLNACSLSNPGTWSHHPTTLPLYRTWAHRHGHMGTPPLYRTLIDGHTATTLPLRPAHTATGYPSCHHLPGPLSTCIRIIFADPCSYRMQRPLQPRHMGTPPLYRTLMDTPPLYHPTICQVP
jgi:hypothetical protein